MVASMKRFLYALAKENSIMEKRKVAQSKRNYPDDNDRVEGVDKGGADNSEAIKFSSLPWPPNPSVRSVGVDKCIFFSALANDLQDAGIITKKTRCHA